MFLDHLLNSPNKISKSPDIHAALRIIAPNEQRSSDDSGNDDISAMDASNRMSSSDEKDNYMYNELMNGDDGASSNDKADSKFMVGNQLNVMTDQNLMPSLSIVTDTCSFCLEIF